MACESYNGNGPPARMRVCLSPHGPGGKQSAIYVFGVALGLTIKKMMNVGQVSDYQSSVLTATLVQVIT